MAFKLEDNEYIILMARRHWITPVGSTIGFIFSLLIPIVIASIVYSFPNVTQFGNLNALALVLIIAWAFLMWNIVFVIWTNHILDVLVITNKHIIDIEQIGLWNRDISTLNLEKIQDISSRTEGLIPNMLDYGDLEIQTAGSITNFLVKRIESPDKIRQAINAQIVKINEENKKN